MIVLLSLLQGCPAERLGVELPEGGVSAISAEDLQRDVFALTRADADAGEVFARRLGQMHLPPTMTGEGRVCARSGGEGVPRVIVAPWPAEGADRVTHAAQAAVLISVAKAWDGPSPPARATWLCLAKAGAALPEGERAAVGVTVAAKEVEGIDYRRLRGETQAYARTLSK